MILNVNLDPKRVQWELHIEVSFSTLGRAVFSVGPHAPTILSLPV